MTGVWFIIVLLATWRLTAFLAYEHWTETLRARLGVEMVDADGTPVTFWGKLFGCFWCLSFLTGTLCALIAAINVWVLLPLACSGGAILLNHVSRVFRYVED